MRKKGFVGFGRDEGEMGWLLVGMRKKGVGLSKK